MPSKPLAIGKILNLLTETPLRIAALTAGLDLAQLHASPGPDEWSANDVLAHLRSCADVWGGCIERIIAEDRPTIRAINPLTWIAKTNYPDLDFRSSLDAFTRQRAALLSILAALPHDTWSRSATVTGAGKPLERTVLTYADWLARHERPHVKQIEHVLESMRA